MEVKLTNGKTSKLKLKDRRIDDQSQSRSQFQHRIGQKLKQQYPHDLIFEEVSVPGENFVLDFFIPSLKLVVECHGKQHTEHIKFFHRTKHQFHKQQERDEKKKKWCELNNFKLVEIFYNEQ